MLRYIAVYVGLFVFGIAYNLAVAWIERRHYDDVLIAVEVVVGVVVTLGGFALLEQKTTLTALLCFASSGAPMVYGSLWRYLKARDQWRASIRGDVENAESETLAE